MWPTDKLSLINQNLLLTGNNTAATADDGSDEWNVASAAYEQAIEYAVDRANWPQLTNIAVLNPSPTVPSDPEYDTAYAKPQDCVHIVWLRQYQQASATDPTTVAHSGRPILYDITGNQIFVNNFNGATTGNTTPVNVLLKYVSSNYVPQNMLRTFMTALGRFVMAGIYRGLHEDIDAARGEEKAAMELLQEAMTRADQEKPKRAFFNSRLAVAGLIRRPWPRTPTGWGGTGSAG